MHNNSKYIASRYNKSLFVIDPDEFKEGLGECHFSFSLENQECSELLRRINARLVFILAALESGRIIQAFQMLELLQAILPFPGMVDFLRVSPRRLARIRSAAQRFEESLLIERAQ